MIQSSLVYFKYPETRESCLFQVTRGSHHCLSCHTDWMHLPPPLFSLLSSALQNFTWQWNSGGQKGAWNLKYTRRSTWDKRDLTVCWSSVDVFSRPGRSLFSTRSLPSLNISCHLNVLVFNKASSPTAFCNILNISAAEISFRTQNLMQLLCSIKSDIVKIGKNTFCWSQKRASLLSQWR